MVNSPDRVHGTGSVLAAYIVLKDNNDIENEKFNIPVVIMINDNKKILNIIFNSDY